MSTIDRLVDKYMRMLAIRGKPPIVHVRTRLGASWLGRTRWTSRMPETSTIELLTNILGDPSTLERVLAHEMIHHKNFLEMTPGEIEMAKLGLAPPPHGPNFQRDAAHVNTIMGQDFVTTMSDRETGHVVAPPAREFFLLIAPLHERTRQLGYAWAGRLSPEAKAIVAEKVAQGGKLLTTRDPQWASGRAKIRRFGGLSVPKEGSPRESELRALYEHA